jgi:hypothetical protein
MTPAEKRQAGDSLFVTLCMRTNAAPAVTQRRYPGNSIARSALEQVNALDRTVMPAVCRYHTAGQTLK